MSVLPFSMTSNKIGVKLADRENHFQIYPNIFVVVSAFKNKVFVHIRHYNRGYPTRNGVFLTSDNWSLLKAILAYDIGMYMLCKLFDIIYFLLNISLLVTINDKRMTFTATQSTVFRLFPYSCNIYFVIHVYCGVKYIYKLLYTCFCYSFF